jgi:hypothetical protein
MRVCILALVIRRANRIFYAPRFVVVCGPSGSTIFFSKLSGTGFGKEYLKIKCVFCFSLHLLSEKNSDSKNTVGYKLHRPGLRVKCPLFSSDVNQK